jgi:Uncharacterized protein conserved in bacteria (DUF2334)
MNNSPTNARYLLRFDDLCPTMGKKQWSRFAQLIHEFQLKPILAIVPDNRDPDLVLDEPDANFWEEMRGLQTSGATIGLHGFQHLCTGSGGGLIPLHMQTEFVGIAEATQQRWIDQGMEILRSHGLDPRIWVAPRHGTDETTLAVLRRSGLAVLSDGFAENPFQNGGVLWIPQQLWGPIEKQSGVWTICLHANNASDDLCEELRQFLTHRATQFTSVDQLLTESPFPLRSMSDRIFHWRLMRRIQFSRWKRKLKSKQRTKS